MDIEALLASHERQHPELSAIVGDIRSMLAEIDDVERQEYQPAKASQLVTEIRQTTAASIATEARAMLDEAARVDDVALADRDAAERERITSANGHDVDPRRFTAAATASEISSLLRDAEAVDADTLKRSWAFAQPVLKQLAARESREHKMPHAASAFNIWTTWQARLASTMHRAPDRAVMSDAGTRRRHELRERILAVCRLASLDSAVAKLLLAADIETRTPPTGGAPAKGALVSGGWFDRFTTKK